MGWLNFVQKSTYLTFRFHIFANASISNNMQMLRDRYVTPVLKKLLDKTILGEQGFPVTPVWWSDNAQEALTSGQSFLVGDSLLVAPVVHENMTKCDVYIPKGSWRKVDTDTGDLADEVIEGGRTLEIEVKIDQIGLFVKQ